MSTKILVKKLVFITVISTSLLFINSNFGFAQNLKKADPKIDGERKLVIGESSFEIKKARAELAKKFPKKSWKTLIFTDYKKKPLMTIKVPSFVNFPSSCNKYFSDKKTQHCAQHEITPEAEGDIVINGLKRHFIIGIEAFEHEELKYPYDVDYFRSIYPKAARVLLENVDLDGHDALLVELDDPTLKASGPYEIQTLIKFKYKYIGGMLYFMELSKEDGGMRFVKHKDRIFQDFIEETIKSVKFKSKVE